MHAPLLVLALLVLGLTVAGCGSGGGGGASAGQPTTALGTRAVPGYTITASARGRLTAGGTVTVRATVTPDAGIPAPVLVEAAIGTEEPASFLTGVLGGNAWTWTVTLPADLAGQHVWVRVTDAEGNIASSGIDDFSLDI